LSQIRYLIAIDIETDADHIGPPSPNDDRRPNPRHLALAATRGANPDRGLIWSGPGNVTERDALLDSLSDRILVHRDYLAGSLFLDADPSPSRSLKALLGIPRDYFAAISPDPKPEEPESIRAGIRRICGRPWAWGRTTVCALEDVHHGLLVRPCDEAISDQETGACRLVFKVFATINEGLDYTYEEWARLFRGEVHEAAALNERREVTEPCQIAESVPAAQSDAAISHEAVYRIERRDEGWVIVSPLALSLPEVERSIWSSDKPLAFDAPVGALEAFLQARPHEEGRKRRYREAMIRLGRPLQGPSRYEQGSPLENQAPSVNSADNRLWGL
jgi:hypothetical protein